MINTGLIIIGGALYFSGQYGAALLLVVLAIISGAGAAVMALINPNWYFHHRMRAGLDVDFFNSDKHSTSLLITKGIIILALVWFARHVAEKAGYISPAS